MKFNAIMIIGDIMKKFLKYIGVFLFFLVILFLVPIAGDDWGNYLAGKKGFIYAFTNAYSLYFTWEGRLVSRVLVTIFTQYKWLFNIISSLLITGTIYMGMKFIGKNVKKICFPLMCCVFLFMNFYTFSQIIPWVTGNIYYFVVVPILLWYFYYLLNNDLYNIWRMGQFILINLLCTMFVENMALVLVGGNILVLFYKYIKNKRIDRKLIIYTVISMISMFAMIISPGSALRNSSENVVFNSLGLFAKIGYNLPNFIYYTFICNPFLLFLLIISSLFMINNNFKNKFIKLLLKFYMIIGPTISIILYPLSLFGNNSIFFMDCSKFYVIIYWFLFLISYIYLLVINDKKDLVNIFLLLLGLCSNGAMLLSPTWGYRTSFFTYLMFSILAIRIINNYIDDLKIFNYLGSLSVFIGCLFYLIFYINVYRCQIDLEKSIEKQLKDDSDIIYINRFPSFVSCNINPTNSYHLDSFKRYYGIPSDKEIIISDSEWKYVIFYMG